MAENEQVSDHEPSYQQHPLYQEAMRQMALGKDAEAADALGRLAELYPGEQSIRDLLLRVELKSAFGASDYIVVEHAAPRAPLRNMVVLLLAITGCLVLVTAMTVVKSRFFDPQVEARERQEYILSLWDEGQGLLQRGDLVRARQVYEELQRELPNDPGVQDALRVVEQREAWAKLYTDAVDLKARGESQSALDLLDQIPPESPNYQAAQRLIAELLEQVALDTAWQDVQALLQAGDADGTISTLDWLRAQNPDYRRTDVENLLYQLHVQQSQSLLSRACGDIDLMRQAIAHQGEALSLRPTDQSLDVEKGLAVAFVAGAEAYAREDWRAAVERWEEIYRTRSDYQCGVLSQRMAEVYPRAAKQLIEEASGSSRLLNQSLTYLDKALALQPDNQELLEERRLVTEYQAGQKAFTEENWNLAISHWGPIYAVRPAYQKGKLEESLRLACASSQEPDPTLCPP